MLFFSAELRERVDRLESRRGAKQQLKALDAKTAELKVLMPPQQLPPLLAFAEFVASSSGLA